MPSNEDPDILESNLRKLYLEGTAIREDDPTAGLEGRLRGRLAVGELIGFCITSMARALLILLAPTATGTGGDVRDE